MPSRLVSYLNTVDPDGVSAIAEDIVDTVDSDDEVWVAAAIHDHVRERVAHDSSVDPGNRAPATIYREGGNCVDLSILLCSLFDAVGLRCRLVALEGGGSGHVTAAVAFPGTPRMVTDSLNGYYCEHGPHQKRTYTWFENEYFVSDHGSRYIGDIGSLNEYTTDRGQVVVQGSIEIID
ncbi:transglutaminase domain-containing protein [Halosimplex marinum]|uniref:transglutaminase domain-containing protein n=1 Tax=Halosimplex marinum TaxID=3396620 RepID=UPI003F56F03E